MFWKYAISLLATLLIITIFLNSLIGENFYLKSLNFMFKAQSGNNFFISTFMNLISVLFSTNFLIALLLVVYICFKRKLASIVFISNFIINVYMMKILKLCYQEQRPFWYDERIKQLEWGCSSQFGNPSGHSWFILLIYEPLIVDFLGAGFLNLGYLLPITAVFLVPISRMYLGSHAGNQVLMGLTLGFIMCALYRIKLQQWFYRLYFRLDSKRVSLYQYLLLIISNIIVILAPIFIYYLNTTFRPISQNYINNLNRACKKQYTSQKLQEGALFVHALVNIVFGFMFGASSTDQTNFMYFLGQWRFESASEPGKGLKFIIKIFLLILIGSPFIIIIFVMIHLPIEMNPYVKYLILCFGFWLLGFSLVAFSNRVLLKTNTIVHQIEEEQIKILDKFDDNLFYF